ncbi:uncharacterized protein LOC126899680 isoform X2 [Daktulosphaira vitifoliae]|uniref:uncharacterized protein LOC126899680 isoform X2 n=1 Tax=Daktulosphaira vitifoliae TaxID=58002 RepID=UPI0021AA9C30|nr:uncharacterized protein LOC126899680 isoform X2 [Daktulosphaira vitifoliae]
MMFTKYFYFLFFLTLVKSNNPILPLKKALLNCFNYISMENDKIIKSPDEFTDTFENFLMRKSIEILLSSDENIITTVAKAISEYECTNCESIESTYSCCIAYAKKVDHLKHNNKYKNSSYESLVRDWSVGKTKVLPKLLRGNSMIVDEQYDPEESSEIVVLADNTEDTDHITMNSYI